MSKKMKEIEAILKDGSGKNIFRKVNPHSEKWRYSYYPVLTEGVCRLFRALECLWLLPIIDIGQYDDDGCRKEIDLWILHLYKNNTGAILSGYVKGEEVERVVINDATMQCMKQEDFPGDEIKLHYIECVLTLPVEHNS